MFEATGLREFLEGGSAPTAFWGTKINRELQKNLGQKIMHNVEELRKLGGVTPYSSSFWDEVENAIARGADVDELNPMITLAINETLAESSKLKYTQPWRWEEIHELWREIHAGMEELYWESGFAG